MRDKARGGHAIGDIVVHAHGSRMMSVPVGGKRRQLGRLDVHAVELGRGSLAKEGSRGELLDQGLNRAVAERAGKGRDGQAGGSG